jgi:hypothetical protein
MNLSTRYRLRLFRVARLSHFGFSARPNGPLHSTSRRHREQATKGASWTADEDKKLEDAVQAHGGKNWKGIAALVPGRTNQQCRHRWGLRSAALTTTVKEQATKGASWTADEDKKLEDAVQAHGGKNWKGIAALVPGRTNTQCRHRWKKRSVAMTKVLTVEEK